ncbi:hypothetical protein Gura_0729 [Geotalea uraniireducens Rf4]|uniref:Uncharacterized protein n=2 Tax=Geotalea uraniireducens TaxID=351604 RepID=A5GBV3_GEOUR|nr:hypothetical protein Gura_0729 [Geotalea uraniireducens Rf4]
MNICAHKKDAEEKRCRSLPAAFQDSRLVRIFTTGTTLRKGERMRKLLMMVILAGFFAASTAALAATGVDLNINIKGGNLPPAPTVQVVSKGDQGKHLGHYKSKKRDKEHEKEGRKRGKHKKH